MASNNEKEINTNESISRTGKSPDNDNKEIAMNIMKNVKIGTKILGLVGILIVLMDVLAGYGILKLKDAGNEVQGLAEQEIPIVAVFNEINAVETEQETLFQRAIRLGITNQAAELRKVDEEFGKKVKEVDELIKKGDVL